MKFRVPNRAAHTSPFDWARETLLRAGAAQLCPQHGHVVCPRDEAALERAVVVARLNPWGEFTPDQAETQMRDHFAALGEFCRGCPMAGRRVED